MYCKNCGKRLAEDDKFCSGCGERVEKRKPVTISEPMFFLDKTIKEEPKPAERKEKRVIHLDEFQWDLDGYPTSPRKTADVDFDWGSVLEDRAKREVPRGFAGEKTAAEKPVAEPVVEAELPKTVEELLATLPEETASPAIEETVFHQEDNENLEDTAEAEATVYKREEEAPVIEPPAQKEPEETDAPEIAETTEAKQEPEFGFVKRPKLTQEPVNKELLEEVKSIEELIAEMGTSTVEEPTRLISKSQIKEESVDRFYIFSRKQAEYQAMLDKEYDKIQSSLADRQEPAAVEEEVRNIADDVVKAKADDKPEVVDTPEPKVEPEPERPLEVIAVIWAKPPAGLIAEPVHCDAAPSVAEPAEGSLKVEVTEDKSTQTSTSGEIAAAEVSQETESSRETEVPEEAEADQETEASQKEEKAQDEKEEETTEDGEKAGLSRDTIIVTKPIAIEEEEKTETAEPSCDDDAEEKKDEKPVITFADIFSEEDEEEDTKSGGFLKVLAIILIILIILEMGVLVIPKVAPDSQAAAWINQGYNKIIGLFSGDEPQTPVEETDGPSEIETIIEAQQSKNENIIAILADQRLLFEEGKDYGFEDFAGSYAFQDSTWYEGEDGQPVTYGNEIVGTIIQFYSALPDKVNDVNRDVIDFVEKTSPYYDEVDALAEDPKREYVVNQLTIGEIRTGGDGFYVLVNVTTTEKNQPEGVMEKQIVYLKPNLSKKEMKIMNIKKI